MISSYASYVLHGANVPWLLENAATVSAIAKQLNVDLGKWPPGGGNTAVWIAPDGIMYGPVSDHETVARDTLKKVGIKVSRQQEAAVVMKQRFGFVRFSAFSIIVIDVGSEVTRDQLAAIGRVYRTHGDSGVSWEIALAGQPVQHGDKYGDFLRKVPIRHGEAA